MTDGNTMNLPRLETCSTSETDLTTREAEKSPESVYGEVGPPEKTKFYPVNREVPRIPENPERVGPGLGGWTRRGRVSPVETRQ